MISCAENPKDATENLLPAIRELSKVTRDKVSTQKSAAFLYANQCSGKEVKTLIPFTIAPKFKCT